MSILFDALKIAAGLITTVIILSMAFVVSDRGKETFNESTEQVAESANMMSEVFSAQFNEKEVGYEDLMTAVQTFSYYYEIRYQTLMHQADGVDYKIFPGTAKGNRASVSETSIFMDKTSADFINTEATWYVTINEDEGYIFFKQEKNV